MTIFHHSADIQIFNCLLYTSFYIPLFILWKHILINSSPEVHFPMHLRYWNVHAPRGYCNALLLSMRNVPFYVPQLMWIRLSLIHIFSFPRQPHLAYESYIIWKQCRVCDCSCAWLFLNPSKSCRSSPLVLQCDPSGFLSMSHTCLLYTSRCV